MAQPRYEPEGRPEPVVRLHFVYNVEATPSAIVMDFLHRIRDPETYPCKLCDLTYTRFRKRVDWQWFVWRSLPESHFYTKDQFVRAHPALAGTVFPVILGETSDGSLVPVIEAAAFRQLSSLEALESELLRRLGREVGATVPAAPIPPAALPPFVRLGETIEGLVASVLGGLPRAVQRLLAGGSAVRVDGQELDPGVQLTLAALRLQGARDFSSMAPAEARATLARSARLVGRRMAAVAAIEDLAIPGPAGPIPARFYVPARDARTRPLVVYYHGGGWVAGGLDTHDGTCRFLAHEADVNLLSVDYRLAPEHRFPAAVDDALAAFQWAVGNAARLGADPERIAVAGDSAGGNLAAVVSQLSCAAEGPAPAVQLLIYPVTDLSTKHESYGKFAKGFFLTAADMDWFRGHYLGDADAALDPRVSPLRATQFEHLPPAIVLTAGFDVLRDEGEAYARRLEAAGVPVRLARQRSLIHGFASMTSVNAASRHALQTAARDLAVLLSR